MTTPIETSSGLADPETGELLGDDEDGEAIHLTFRELDLFCAFLGFTVLKASNGATYVVVFEVPTFASADLAAIEDGFSVAYTPDGEDAVFIGHGAFITNQTITRDADGDKHLKLKIKFSQSEIHRSIGALGTIIGQDRTRGRLTLRESQGSLDLTKKA